MANIYAYVYFSRFFPRRETNPPKERKKDFFLKQSIRTFETNFAIEKLVQTIKLIEYHLEDLGFRLDITSSIWAKHRYWPFSKLIPRNSISLRSVVDKFRTISTARSLIYVNTNALLYKLVERLPIVYHRVKMQRVKYNWQSFNLLSDFDIFFFFWVTSFFKPLRFASHYRKYPLDGDPREDSPSFQKKGNISRCASIEGGINFFANYTWKINIFEITRLMVILINSNCVDKSNWNFQFPPILSETFQIFQRWTSLGLIEQHPNEKFAKIHLRLRKKDPSWLVFIVIERRGFRWFMPIFADPSGKQSGWFVRNHVPSAEARQRPCRRGGPFPVF